MVFLRNKNTQYISQIFLGGLFIYASIGKLLDPETFANAINNYKLLPYFLVRPIALILPYIEFIFGAFLIFSFWTKTSAMVLSLLLFIFTIAIFSTIIRGISIDCGCFGKFLKVSEAGHLNKWKMIVRDILFIIPGIIVSFSPKNRRRKKS